MEEGGKKEPKKKKLFFVHTSWIQLEIESLSCHHGHVVVVVVRIRTVIVCRT